MDKLLMQCTAPVRAALQSRRETLDIAREIRIRLHRPLLLRGEKDVRIEDFRPDEKDMRELLLAFCGNALYAHEEQLRCGYLTLQNGHRVGVCGRMVEGTEGKLRFAQVQGMSVRIARQLPCDPRAVRAVHYAGTLHSALIVSPPGLGKTTLLREVARQLSDRGTQIAIADERGELAACHDGVPQLDVGENTDVMDNMEKAAAIRMLLRSMAPELIVCDEIGSEEDAQALLDARKSGVKVLCSAHGASVGDIKRRSAVHALLQEGVFDRIVLLGGKVGRIHAIYDGEGRPC